MVNRIKFAVIGCGRIGSRHAENIAKIDRAQLIAVCDIVEEKANLLSDKYSAKAYYDYKEVLKLDVDVINVCTPSGLHTLISIDALKANKNVLCEKPMTLNLTDADSIVAAEKSSKGKFFLVKQNRYNPPVKVLKDLISKDKLGKISLINCNVMWNRRKDYYDECDWRGTMEMDGGALMTQCSHFLDLVIWMGGPVKNIFAKMKNLTHDYIETEDTGFITIEFENGSIGSLQYTTSVYKKNLEGSMTVIGTNGTVKIGGEYINTLEFFDVKDMEKPELEAGNPANDYGSYKGSMSNHDKVIENVVSVLLDNAEIKTNSLQGRESIEVMQAAYLSAKVGRVINLPLTGDDYNFKIDKEEPISGNKKK